MYSIVLLKTEPKHLTIIPIEWFASLDIVQIFNIGISHTKRHRIFFSADITDEPFFNIEPSTIFDEIKKANYLACVHSVWGTYDAAEKHLGSRRSILPAIYNANLERYHWAQEPEIVPEPYFGEIKEEPIADLLWMNGQIIDLEESDNENENENENGNENQIENENELEGKN